MPFHSFGDFGRSLYPALCHLLHNHLPLHSPSLRSECSRQCANTMHRFNDVHHNPAQGEELSRTAVSLNLELDIFGIVNCELCSMCDERHQPWHQRCTEYLASLSTSHASLLPIFLTHMVGKPLLPCLFLLLRGSQRGQPRVFHHAVGQRLHTIHSHLAVRCVSR